MMGNYHVQFGGQFILIRLYLICTIYRNSEQATGGGLTYFLLGGLSSCFILLGSSLLYANSGTTNLDGLYVITSLSEMPNQSYLALVQAKSPPPALYLPPPGQNNCIALPIASAPIVSVQAVAPAVAQAEALVLAGGRLSENLI